MTHCTGSSAAHAVRFLLQAIHSSIGRVCVMLSVNQFAMQARRKNGLKRREEAGCGGCWPFIERMLWLI